MPLIKSAIKKMRQDRVRTDRNRLARKGLHEAIKAVEKAVTQKKGDFAALLKTAFSKIDKAAKKNLIHKNNAANKKSRLSRLGAKIPKNK